MVTSRHHSLRASRGDWWVDIITISTNEQTLWSTLQYHHFGDIVLKNIHLIFFIVTFLK